MPSRPVIRSTPHVSDETFPKSLGFVSHIYLGDSQLKTFGKDELLSEKQKEKPWRVIGLTICLSHSKQTKLYY